MSQALRQLIGELRAGAELSIEGTAAIQWRARIKDLPAISIQAHGAGLFVIGTCARNLLLQRGQVSSVSDEALRGVVVELANVLQIELEAQEARRKTRAVERREQPYYLRDSA